MKDFCFCEGYKTLKEQDRSLFGWDPNYGWVLSWIELTEDFGYTQVHRYGVKIEYCPMCGRSLSD